MKKIFFGFERFDRVSSTAYILGYGGLIPFVCFTLYGFRGVEHLLPSQDLFYFYGLTILSFLGAPHWGFVFTRQDLIKSQKKQQLRLFIGILPALFAFSSVFFSELGRLIILLIGFIFILVFDVFLFRSEKILGWYLPLRKRLSFIVLACLVTNIFFISK